MFNMVWFLIISYQYYIKLNIIPILLMFKDSRDWKFEQLLYQNFCCITELHTLHIHKYRHGHTSKIRLLNLTLPVNV